MLSTVLPLSAFLAGVAGHSSMYEPPSRSSGGMNILSPGCMGGACLWFTQGTQIGCAEPTDNKTGCDNPSEPTILQDDRLRTYNLNNSRILGDWTKYNPWRHPGVAPVANSCGMAGGGFDHGIPGYGVDPPPGYPIGMPGTDLPPLLETTVWKAGGVAEVAWSVFANHGGGYQYRLCPAGEVLDEKCFQQHTLEYASDSSWFQFGPDGKDINNRTEFKAARTNTGTFPLGSTWTKNPIPACKGPFGGASQRPCNGPQFPPVRPDLYGFGGAACQIVSTGGKNFTGCTLEEFRERFITYGIVDKVKVPDVPDGAYVLSFRWDSEQGPQVWTTCSDLNISHTLNPTQPFIDMNGCESCCAQPGQRPGICSNCRACTHDKTGDCAHCWAPLPGFNPDLAPKIGCLGHETAEGGPPVWAPGMEKNGGWSPGCSKCWATEGSCTPRVRK